MQTNIPSFCILWFIVSSCFNRKIVINKNYVISDRRLSLLNFCGNEAFSFNFCDGCRRKCYKYLLDFTSLLLIIIRCPIGGCNIHQNGYSSNIEWGSGAEADNGGGRPSFLECLQVVDRAGLLVVVEGGGGLNVSLGRRFLSLPGFQLRFQVLWGKRKLIKCSAKRMPFDVVKRSKRDRTSNLGIPN